jgi:hypothetical protein
MLLHADAGIAFRSPKKKARRNCFNHCARTVGYASGTT